MWTLGAFVGQKSVKDVEKGWIAIGIGEPPWGCWEQDSGLPKDSQCSDLQGLSSPDLCPLLDLVLSFMLLIALVLYKILGIRFGL